MKDSLKIDWWSSALKEKINGKFNTDSLDQVRRLDNVGSIGKQKVKLQGSLDSHCQKKAALLKEVDKKRNDLMTDAKGKLSEWENKVREKKSSLIYVAEDQAE